MQCPHNDDSKGNISTLTDFKSVAIQFNRFSKFALPIKIGLDLSDANVAKVSNIKRQDVLSLMCYV